MLVGDAVDMLFWILENAAVATAPAAAPAAASFAPETRPFALERSPAILR